MKILNFEKASSACLQRIAHFLSWKYGKACGEISIPISSYQNPSESCKSNQSRSKSEHGVGFWKYSSLLGLDYTSSIENCTSMTTVIDKYTREILGEPYRGKPDLRFDKGTAGRQS